MGVTLHPFDQAIADEICKAISTTTDGLGKLCKKNEHWPPQTTINEWRLAYSQFNDQYARAKQLQADLLVESILDTSRNNENDTIIGDDGRTHSNMAAIQRDRLVVDSIKWIACKLMPKVYGDKQTVDSTVTINHEDSIKDLA
jgi:hypothetical protein